MHIMIMTNHIISCKVYSWLATTYLLLICNNYYYIHTDSKACSCVASLSSRDKPTQCLKKMDNWKRKLAKRGSATKRQLVKLQVKFKLNINGDMEEITVCGNVDIVTVWETHRCATRGTP